MKRAVLDAARKARAGKGSVAVVTHLASGRQAVVQADGAEGELELGDDQIAEVRTALRHDRSGTIGTGDERLFVHAYNPPLRLILVGAVHIAQALAPMAGIAGYAVSVIDPRGAWATKDRFPDIALIDDWPDEAMEALTPDSRTAVVTLTHDPKLDDPALETALRSEAFYIGALGSKKTHANRLERLRARDFDDEALARIHGPLGLPLGGRSPGEIAIAALAQITQVLHKDAE